MRDGGRARRRGDGGEGGSDVLAGGMVMVMGVGVVAVYNTAC